MKKQLTAKQSKGVAKQTEIWERSRLCSIALQLQPRFNADEAAAAAAAEEATAIAQRSLPSRVWHRMHTTLYDSSSFTISSFSVHHGRDSESATSPVSAVSPVPHRLPLLQVRVLHSHCIHEGGSESVAELDAAVDWLVGSVEAASQALLGFACKWDEAAGLDADRSVRLIQLSSATRCLLICVPDQDDIRRVLAASPDRQFEQAASSALSPAAARATLFSPKLRALLNSATTIKAGMDTVTPAVSLWADCPSVEVNGCVSLGWLHESQTLMELASKQLGADFVRLSDRMPDPAGHWSLPSLIHCAIEAQASAVLTHSLQLIPRPFHLSEHPANWLMRMDHWQRAGRTQKAARVHGDDCDRMDAELVAAIDRFFLLGCQSLEPFCPFVEAIMHASFPSQARIEASLPAPHPSLQVAGRSETLLASLDFAFDRSNVSWWLRAGKTAIEPNYDQTYVDGAAWQRLDASQRSAIESAESARIHIVGGAAGSGLTTAAAAAAMISLSRCSSVLFGPDTPREIRMAAQRVLCVCQSDAAARALADALLTIVPSSSLSLLVSPSFISRWNTSGVALPLRLSGCVVEEPVSAAECPIVVCTLERALSASFPISVLHFRQTLIFDSAQTVPLLSAMLLCRKLPHTERMIVVGDESIAGGHAEQESLLMAALAVRRTSGLEADGLAARLPLPLVFRPTVSRLLGQYRFPSHLSAMLAETIYQDAITVAPPPRPLSLARSVGCVELDSSLSDETPIQLEIDKVASLWNAYAVRPGFTQDQIAILTFSPSARDAIVQQQPAMIARVLLVDDFESQQAAVVLVCLVSGSLGPSARDRYRLSLACSRASSKLYLICDASVSLSHCALLDDIIEFAQRNISDVFEQEHDADQRAILPADGPVAVPRPVSVPSTSPAPLAALALAPAPPLSAALVSHFPALGAAPPSSAAPDSLPFVSLAHRMAPPTFAIARTEQATASIASTSHAAPAAVVVASAPLVSLPLASTAVSAASAVSSSSSLSRPSPLSCVSSLHSFVPVGAKDRPWKLLVCRAFHGPTKDCRAGTLCPHLHNECWVQVSDAGDFWCITPGSRVIRTEQIHHEARLEQMRGIISSALNQKAKAKVKDVMMHYGLPSVWTAGAKIKTIVDKKQS